METITIPNGNDQVYDSVSIQNYSSVNEQTKTRITLNQNIFAFLREGYKTVTYLEKHTHIDNTQILLLSIGNCLISEKNAAENGLYKSTMLLFDNTVLTNFFVKYPLVLSASGTSVKEEPFIVFSKDEFLKNFITSLDLILSSGQEFTLDMKRIKFDELMLYLCGKYPQQIANLRTSIQQTREDYEIKRAVESNLDNNVTVEELAFLCNTSVSTFKRRFMKIYGSSPNKWMIQKRMEMAANLLRQGSEKPSDIYYKVGYESLSSFIQSFKQIYGVTPKEYQLQKLNV